MEEFLLRLGSHAATFAIRSGVSLAGGFAIRQVTKFIQDGPTQQTQELEALRERLETKIKIVTPAIDLIERIAAKGNTSLASTVILTTALRNEINQFAQRVADATEAREGSKQTSGQIKSESQRILSAMRSLLSQIEDVSIVTMLTVILTYLASQFRL